MAPGHAQAWLELLRWHKPSGRLILLIPAGWALWLGPAVPPPALLVGWIVLGGLAVSGAGCVANDLWDRRIDPLVERTRHRPLADGRLGVGTATVLLLLCLVVALAALLGWAGSHVDWAGLQADWALRIGGVALTLGTAALVYFGLLALVGVRPRQFMRRG